MTEYSPTSKSAHNFIIKYNDGTTYACAFLLSDAHRWAKAETERSGKTTLVYEYIGLYRKGD